MSHKILVSNGEILDKLTILYIKQKYCNNTNQLFNINQEISVLEPFFNSICTTDEILSLYNKLLDVNRKLWIIEDSLRNKEKSKTFDSDFIELARQVYKTNDLRASLKKQINYLSASTLIEEKIYDEYN